LTRQVPKLHSSTGNYQPFISFFYGLTDPWTSLNGDYNPLHATPEPGKKMGFGGTIIHGLYSWNATAHAVLRELGGSNPKNLQEFQARFASPVRPGDKLTTEMWKTGETNKDGFEEVRFVTKNQDGKTVLSNGRALVKIANRNSKL
jgi:acyl dehydratase